MGDAGKAMNQLADAIAPPRLDCGGKSILEMIWGELDEIYGQLMMSETRDGRGMPEGAFLRGRALGLATAIAIIVNPYAPNVDAVRAEARARWEAS